MILVSKFIFGSVALATFAGSVAFPDAGEAARRVAASIRELATTEEQPAPVQQAQGQQPEVAGSGSVQLPPAPPPCPGRCEVWELFSQIR